MAQEDELEQKQSKKRLSSATEDEPECKKRAAVSSADKDWNVDDCRGDHESVEHWELRKHFLVENMDRFPNKNRLVCLSQVFANMEFLGCRYPEETMELVHELSLGIVESYREKQKSRLQRTFVKASAAAERKTKGSNYSSTNKAAHSVFSSDKRSSFSINPTALSSYFVPSQQPLTNDTTTVPYHQPSFAGGNRSSTDNTFQNDGETFGDVQKMVLLVFAYNQGENAVSIVHRSCSAANVPIFAEFHGSHENYLCTYHIGTNMVVESSEEHKCKDAAKYEAAKIAFEKLQKLCYTFVTKVQVSRNFGGKEIAKDEVDGALPVSTDGGPQISDSNIGNKLLKLMGWSGGGLGKNEQGRHEAVSVDGVVGRSRLGLGNNSKGAFFKKMKGLLEQQQQAGFTHDLKFASDFSKDERKDIHMIAQKLGLRSKSYGKDEDRYIVVSEKVSRMSLVQSTLENGGETDKYKVIPPGGSLEGIEKYI